MAKITAVSPLAPASFPDLPVIAGVRLATAEAGVRYKGRTDVMLAVLDPGTAVAGVFTRSATRSAPVLDCQAKLGGDSSTGAAILVNSGNSNAFTGQRGQMSVKDLTEAAAKTVGIPASRVFTASTGVIGEPLPHEKIIAKLDELNGALTAEAIKGAAKAIMTTDTYPKVSTASVELDGVTVTINGIAKGAGMIAPDMATMLSFIYTDAPIAPSVLQALLSGEVDGSFNAVTVDSDTSTSDTLLAFATGKAGVEPIASLDDPRAEIFGEALRDVLFELAIQVVRDGEGATKHQHAQVVQPRQRS